jgi:hypothetical protein
MGMTRPHPLPAQALDHGTGYLLAAAVCRALARATAARETWAIGASLARTAHWLTGLGDDGDPRREDLTAADASRWLVETQTPWGPLGVVRCPGRIAGISGNWERSPGPLGCDTSEWT